MQETQLALVRVAGVFQHGAAARSQCPGAEFGGSLVRGEAEFPHVGIHLALIILRADKLATGNMAEQQVAAARAAAVQTAGAQTHAVQETLVQLSVEIALAELAVGYFGASVVPGFRLITGIGQGAAPFEP